MFLCLLSACIHNKFCCSESYLTYMIKSCIDEICFMVQLVENNKDDGVRQHNFRE